MRTLTKKLNLSWAPMLVLIGCGHTVTDDGVGTATGALVAGSVKSDLTVINDWGNGYCANVSIVNQGSVAVTSWAVNVAMNQANLFEQWNGTFTPTSSGYTITPTAGQNESIAAGATVTLGFCGSGTGASYLPTLVGVDAKCGPSACATTPSNGLQGQYYDNVDFTSLKLTRSDPAIDFQWGNNAPDPSIGADTFSVRWTGQVLPQYSETYTFYTSSDDGVRLWVDGRLVIDNWTDHAATENSGTVALTAGKKVDVKMEYYERGGAATARLSWSSSSQAKQIVPQTRLFPTIPSGTGGGGGAGGSDGSGEGAGGSTGTGGSAGAIIEPGNPGNANLTFEIRSNSGVRPISPYIYGQNSASNIGSTKQGMVRAGGNRYTAYNWENNASNAGSDWHYQNDGQLSSSNTPGEAARSTLDAAFANGAGALLTVPILDYVAADKKGDGDVRNSGSNYLSTRFKQNRAKKGAAFTLTPDDSDAYVYQDEFVNWVKTNYPNGSVVFDLDNEPDLWSATHAEVHPNPVSYSELVERNTRFATAVKDVWPQAKVAGFVSYGWAGFVNLQNAPDANGNGDFIEYYLSQMKAAESAAGKRLVDYLDLHWYPEAQGNGTRIVDGDNSDGVAEARMQAPRSLWDASYTETSWISQYSTNGPIRLIPRIQAKIDAKYPGTALGVTEWNYGGSNHISGAIATADVLGIFGREGVGLACNWALSSDQAFQNAAFRVYRNFDGAGAHFADTSISATTNDAAASSVYASVDSRDAQRVVIVAINKRSTTQPTAIRIAHTVQFTKADVYALTSDNAQINAATGLNATATNAFAYTMPARSVSVIVPKP